jgi:two-component system cell cycle response regulator
VSNPGVNPIRPPTYEGIRAYINALERAQKELMNSKVDGIKTVRRISRSLQHAPALKDPQIIQNLSNLQKAKDDEIGAHLQTLLPRLTELISREAADDMVILLLEDDPITAGLMKKELLLNNRQVHVAGSIKEAKAILSEKEISMAILDLVLPDGDGRDLLVQIRQNAPTAMIPIIVLSSKSQNEIKTECFALGADAYFEKPCDPSILAAAVAVKLQRLADLTQQATLDSVTHLPNRMVFYQAFARTARLNSRTKDPLSIAILDLDRFKSVNDISGHHMGDIVLQKIAGLLSRTLRRSDLLVRWGGEEFAVLFPNTDLAQAQTALNKALAALRRQTFETPEGRPFKMTFSAGVTQVEPGVSVEEAVAEADKYLYLAKAAGRNHVLSPEDRVDNLQRNILLVEDDDFMASLLRRFLEKEGFRIFHARDGKTALSLCSQAAFSLITLDVKLPDIDGFDLLGQFRQTPTIRNIPIIMLTSTGKEQDVIRGFRLGADDYILKPFSPSQFLARANRLLEKQS